MSLLKFSVSPPMSVLLTTVCMVVPTLARAACTSLSSDSALTDSTEGLDWAVARQSRKGRTAHEEAVSSSSERAALTKGAAGPPALRASVNIGRILTAVKLSPLPSQVRRHHTRRDHDQVRIRRSCSIHDFQSRRHK